MAKNKGKFGKGKPKVEEADEFVSTAHRIGERLKPHVIPISAALGVLALLLVTYYTYSWWQARKERTATTSLVKALEVADRRVVTADEPAAPVEPNNKQVTYKTEKERSEAVLKALGAVNDATKVGKNARLLEAGALYDLDRYDEAAKLYRAVANSGASRGVKRVAQEGLGYALEAKAAKDKSVEGLKQALEAFKKIQTDEKGPGYDVALFHQGRVLAKLKNKDEAVAAFKKLVALKPPSIFNADAERRLAVLEGGDSYPKPVKKKVEAPKDDDGADKKGADKKGADKKDADKKDADAKKPAPKK